jgi:hypothetical protein
MTMEDITHDRTASTSTCSAKIQVIPHSCFAWSSGNVLPYEVGDQVCRRSNV